MFLQVVKNGHPFPGKEKKIKNCLANKIVRNIQNSQVKIMETKLENYSSNPQVAGTAAFSNWYQFSKDWPVS